MSTETPLQTGWRREFESMSESTVRLLAQPNPSQFTQDDKRVFAKVWIEEQESRKRDAREEKTLAIASEALEEAKRANGIASASAASRRNDRLIALAAVGVAILAASDKIKSFIENFLALALRP